MTQDANRHGAIIFDLGGVLLDFDHKKTCQRLAQKSSLTLDSVYEAIFTSGLEAKYDVGLPTRDFYAGVMELFEIDLPMDEFSSIWCDIFSEKPRSVDLLRRLKARKERLCMLSNTNELHFEYVRSKFPFIDECFDESNVFLSYKLGSKKPEPEIYQMVIKEIGLDPSELIFIDDREDNVMAARQQGIRSTLFTSSEALEALFF